MQELLPLGLGRVEALFGEGTEATVQVQVDFSRGRRNGHAGLRVRDAEADFFFVLIFLGTKSMLCRGGWNYLSVEAQVPERNFFFLGALS
jgi:hypothetical protein